ncbi:hypothetical protein D9758_011569 [Tetrapyrgos nigripes]|uniref:Uncharacterized protein n=1 Tax=Tetrapyrgos nigripes TaxID=182062 RepID=A0A8H5CND9_9AGAR|nr:hypothetical protein D9758_011569 [Tetrapyrgos nigripes]
MTPSRQILQPHPNCSIRMFSRLNHILGEIRATQRTFGTPLLKNTKPDKQWYITTMRNGDRCGDMGQDRRRWDGMEMVGGGKRQLRPCGWNGVKRLEM